MTNLRNKLTNVAVWLENGCEPAMAARELREICGALPDEPPASTKFQVHVQRNVIGLSHGFDYPKSIEHVPFGPLYDTEDAAKLSVAGKGWMDLWWNVRPVNRGEPKAPLVEGYCCCPKSGMPHERTPQCDI